jgi:hypothetical protein
LDKKDLRQRDVIAVKQDALKSTVNVSMLARNVGSIVNVQTVRIANESENIYIVFRTG